MRQLALAAVVALIAGSSLAQDIQKLDQMNGFLNVTLGTAMSAYDDAVVDQKGNVEVMYRRENQQLEFAGLTLERVRYRTFGQKIVSLELTPATAKDSDLLLRLLEKVFGAPRMSTPAPGARSATWLGKRVRLTYVHDPAQKLYEAEFTNLALEQEAARAAAAIAGNTGVGRP